MHFEWRMRRLPAVENMLPLSHFFLRRVLSLYGQCMLSNGGRLTRFHNPDHIFYELTRVDSPFITQLTYTSRYLKVTDPNFFLCFFIHLHTSNVFFQVIVVFLIYFCSFIIIINFIIILLK